MAVSALDGAPVVDPAAYAIGGAPPRHAVRPADRDALCAVLRACARDDLTVVPWGAGTGLAAWRGAGADAAVAAPAPGALPRYDVAIDLRGLDRVVEYEPDDLTLTAECGVTVAALRARLAARGQELPLEAPQAERATLGGTLAANASGARRLRFGGPRDRILGARFALGDGTLVRTGGKVVKNVAGYGIHRLLCGSRGGLAILVDASLKLMPAPETRIALVFTLDDATVADAARWAGFPREEPAVLTIARGVAAAGLPGAGAGAWWCAVGIEEDAAHAEPLRRRAIERLGAPRAELRGAGAEALWQALADAEALVAGAVFGSAHRIPAALPPLEAREVVFHAACGRLAVGASTAADAGSLERAGFVAADRPDESRPVAIRTLRAAIRAALDPGRRFALGDAWERGAG